VSPVVRWLAVLEDEDVAAFTCLGSDGAVREAVGRIFACVVVRTSGAVRVRVPAVRTSNPKEIVRIGANQKRRHEWAAARPCDSPMWRAPTRALRG